MHYNRIHIHNMYAMLPFLFTQCEYDMLFLRPDGAHVRVWCALLETLPDSRSLQTLVCCIAQSSIRHVVCGHHFLRYMVAVFRSKRRHKVISMAALLGLLSFCLFSLRNATTCTCTRQIAHSPRSERTELEGIAAVNPVFSFLPHFARFLRLHRIYSSQHSLTSSGS